MEELSDRPFPPAAYPVVVVGSGPGGLQVSYYLTRLGIGHAVISADRAPGGMFQRFPVFQRLITWTKPYAPAQRHSAAYEWFDWNSLLGEEPQHQFLVGEVMEGSTYFPTRAEMEYGLRSFASLAAVGVRYAVTWESTRREDDGFVLTTSDGEYRCRVVIFATGMAQPWKPTITGVEHVRHYVDVGSVHQYTGKRVLLIGKRNSGFELADAMLAHAQQIILASPRPARISVLTHSTAAARARYLQPYEDHVLGGGNVVLDASIERVDRTDSGFEVHLKTTQGPRDLLLGVDEVIAATGFAVPLGDLPRLGVATFHQNRLPAQTPFWESATVPGIYFAGAITQGAIGLKKYGIPSNSSAVHGFRYNARVLARHIAQKHFDVRTAGEPLHPRDLVDYLLSQATRTPDLWNQQSYLARVVEGSPSEGLLACGTSPLAHFVDAAGPDGVAVAVETDADGDIHPAVYVRRRGDVSEHLLPSDPLHNFESAAHRAQLTTLLAGVMK